MKNFSLVACILFLSIQYSFGQGVGINNTGVSPDNSAMLDIVSPNKGMLIPRVALTSTADATTITNGNVLSLLVFNTATVSDVLPGYYYWDGTVWKTMGGDTNTDNQDLSLSGTTLSLTNDGTTVDLTLLQDQDWYKVGGTSQSTLITDDIFTQGFVGIGALTPAAPLHIKTTGNSPLLVESTDPVSRVRVIDNTGEVAVVSSNDNMYLTTSGSNVTTDSRVAILANGDVGIGTNVPNYRLHVEENTDAQIGVGIWNSDNVGANASEIMIVGQAGSNKYGYLGHVNDGYINGTYPNVTPNMTLLYGGGDIGITAGSATSDITFGNALLNSRTMIIKGSGNVGIGTIAPLQKLDVFGNIKVNNTAATLFLKDTDATLSTDGMHSNVQFKDQNENLLGFVGFGTSAQGMSIINSNTNGAIHWSVGGTFNNMYLSPAGDLGIGTTAPAEKLEIQGSVKIVDGTQGLGKVLISDATGKGSWTNLLGTAWVAVTGSRSINTTYTNTSGKPMYVSVALNHNGGISSGTSTFVIDGLAVGNFVPQGGWNIFIHAYIVPVGSTYSVITSGTAPLLQSWNER